MKIKRGDLLFKALSLGLIGISGGIGVGNAAAAFIVLLEIVPRLMQLTNSRDMIKVYEWIIIVSSVVTSLSYFLNLSIGLKIQIILIVVGLVFGMFVGLLASALAEILNVIPVLSRKLNIGEYIYYVMFAIAFGKIVGSLFYWLSLTKK